MIDFLIHQFRGIQFPGKVRITTKITPSTGIKTAKIFEWNYDLDLSDHIQRMMYMGTFEREESSIVRRFLKPGMTFVDVGANVGYFTAMAASRVGAKGRVVAVEPSPVAGAHLEHVIGVNQAKNVRLERVGLARNEGEFTLYLPDPAIGNHSPTASSASGGMPVVVTVHGAVWKSFETGMDTEGRFGTGHRLSCPYINRRNH